MGRDKDVLFCLAFAEELGSHRRSGAAEGGKAGVEMFLLRRGGRNYGASFCDRSSGNYHLQIMLYGRWVTSLSS